MTSEVFKPKKMHFIINPAAGRLEPILPVINAALKDSGVEWDISITKKGGDGTRLAEKLAQENNDVIAVYGGDGTIREVISGIVGKNVPVGILPGGTGNILATEMGIPGGLKEACELIVGGQSTLRTIDLGEFNHRYFTQRTSYGYETEMIKGAKRSTKNRFGRLAYVISSIKALKKMCLAEYDISVDGQKHQVKGVTCIVANSGNMGFSNKLKLDKAIDVSDGLLDILVVKKVHIGLLHHLYRTVVRGESVDDHELVAHWQGREIQITSRPTQTVQCDGEIVGNHPIYAKVVPRAIQIVSPLIMPA